MPQADVFKESDRLHQNTQTVKKQPETLALLKIGLYSIVAIIEMSDPKEKAGFRIGVVAFPVTHLPLMEEFSIHNKLKKRRK